MTHTNTHTHLHNHKTFVQYKAQFQIFNNPDDNLISFLIFTKEDNFKIFIFRNINDNIEK